MRLEATGLSKSFGRQPVLDNVDLRLEGGSICALFGRNGVGKSTLFRTLVDLIPFTGSVTIDGVEYRESDDATRSLCALANDDNLFPSDWPLARIISGYARLRAVDEEKIREDISVFHLKLKRKWEKLSTGERMILKTVLALDSGAKFIFLDEPVLGLDAINRDRIYRMITERLDEETCIVISSHIIDEAAGLADRILFLSGGKIILDESAQDIEAYSLSGRSEDLRTVKGEARVVLREQKLGLEHLVVLGRPEVAGSVKVERIDTQELFIAMTKEEEV